MKKNILANIVGKFWSVLSGFLFIPLYIKYLGFESYSVISFTLIIAGVMAVLDAGLTATLSREFARSDQSIKEKSRIFNTLETIYFLIIICTSILVFLFANSIANNWLNLKNVDPSKVSLIIKIIGFEVGFQMLFRFYMGGVLGFEEQVKANMFQVCWGVFRNGLVVVAIYISPILEVFFAWQLITTIIFTVLMRLSLLKILNVNFSFFRKPILEKQIFIKVWKFAGGMLLISLVAALNTQMDKLTISKLLDIENLGYYTLAVSLAVGIHLLISPISVAVLPRFTALYSEGKRLDAVELYKKVNLLAVIIMFTFMSSMIFHANDLIWVWTGDSSLSRNAGIFLPILSFSYSMLGLQVIPFIIAIANGYTKLNNALGIISLFLTMPGYWFATKEYGGIGAAYVFCIVQTLITVIYLHFINKKFLNVSKSELFIKKLIFPLFIAISLAYGFSLIPNILSESRFLTLGWIGVVTALTLICNILIFIPVREIRDIFKL